MSSTIQSIEDNNKRSYKNLSNIIFRQYEKSGDKFIGTNNFYLSEDIGNGKVQFNSFKGLKLLIHYEKIIPYENNVYIFENKSLKKYIDLTILHNISFSLEDININKSDIIKKFLDCDISIDDKLLSDIYYNEDFSKKINLELPNKYNKSIILEDIVIDKIYLFKINLLELNRNFESEYNIISK